MRRGYARIRKNGPPEADQLAALKAAGVDVSANGPVYVDGRTEARKRRKIDPADPLPQRTWAIRHLRSGDEMVAPDAGTLGTSEADILGVLAAIGRRKATLVLADDGKAYRWTKEAADIAALAKAGGDQVRRENSSAARRAAAAKGWRGGRKAILVGKVLERAEQLWADSDVQSGRDVIDALWREFKVRVSSRTLYNALGTRTGAIDGIARKRRSN